MEKLIKAMKALAEALMEYAEKNEREPYHDYESGAEEVELPDEFELTHIVHKATKIPCCVVQRVLDLAERILDEDDEVMYYDLAPIIREKTGLQMVDIKAVLATADRITSEEEDDDEQD